VVNLRVFVLPVWLQNAFVGGGPDHEGHSVMEYGEVSTDGTTRIVTAKIVVRASKGNLGNIHVYAWATSTLHIRKTINLFPLFCESRFNIRDREWNIVSLT
jgi:hypothetical protein